MKVRDVLIGLACLLFIAFSIFAFAVYGFSIFIVWKSGHPYISICLGFFIVLAMFARWIDE